MDAQRNVVVSVALGATLAIAAWASAAALDDAPDGGWFMYSPDSTTMYGSSSDGSVWRTALIWLAAIAIWFLVSWRIFRSEE